MENSAVNGKKIAAGKAVEYIKNGMTLGLGTGSTAYWAIQAIGELVRNGLSVRAIATSVQSESLARELNIPIVAFSEIDHLDITIDGADEVDEKLNLIKGGGGALLREKIVASATRLYIIIVDESKLVRHLGKFPLPVEVAPPVALGESQGVAVDQIPLAIGSHESLGQEHQAGIGRSALDLPGSG